MNDLSVIIPVYNTKPYLEECVGSVLKQTLRNLEIILVDDESPDKAGVLCDELASKYKNIRVIHKKNQGLGLARNSGLEIAQGKYVIFLDSDDFLEPDYCEKMVHECSDKKADICISGGYIRYSAHGHAVEAFGIDEDFLLKGEQVRKHAARIISATPAGNDALPCSACMCIYNRSFIEKHQLRFRSEREMASEDIWFNLDCMLCADIVASCSAVGYHYRYNEASLTRSYNPKRFEKLVYFTEQLEKKCRENSIEDCEKRIAYYFWINYEKCVNQEIRYKEWKNAHLELKRMCENPTCRKMLTNIVNADSYHGFHKLLALWLYNGKYLLCVNALRLYNTLVHGKK